MHDTRISWPRSARSCANLDDVDHHRLASEILRALRGRRSQPAFSRRLGYRSNVVYRWESGKTFPTAAKSLQAAKKVGVDLSAGYGRFFRGIPERLRDVDPASPEGVTELLRNLVGITPIGEVARRAHRSRFAVSRWLKGTAEPRLPELLLIVDAASQRLLDFVAVLVDPAGLPSAAGAWAELQAARDAAYSAPWSHAVLRVLELDEYRKLGRHESGWIASRLGIPLEEEQRCLELLACSKQIRRVGRRWVIDETRTVDTRADPQRSQEVKRWWTQVALQRTQEGYQHRSSYALFNVSERDLTEVAALYLEFYNRLRALVTRSEPCERVVLLTTQLVALENPSLLAEGVLDARRPGKRSSERPKSDAPPPSRRGSARVNRHG